MSFRRESAAALSALATVAVARPCPHRHPTASRRRRQPDPLPQSDDLSADEPDAEASGTGNYDARARHRAGPAARRPAQSWPSVARRSRPSPRVSAARRSWTTTADRDTAQPRPARRLPHRAVVGFGTSIAMGYVRAHLADLGLTSGGPRHASASPGLRRHRRYPPLSRRRSRPRRHGVQQRAQGQRHQDRPADLDPGLAGLRPGGQGRQAAAAPELSAADAREAAAPTSAARVSASSPERSSADRRRSPGRTTTRPSSSGSSLRRPPARLADVRAGGGDDSNYQHVIDATTGGCSTVTTPTNFDRGDACVFDNYPGAPSGGTPDTSSTSTRPATCRCRRRDRLPAGRQVRRRLVGRQRRQPSRPTTSETRASLAP